MTHKNNPTQLISVRVPLDLLDQLPPANSMTGERTNYVLDAIREKLKRENGK